MDIKYPFKSIKTRRGAVMTKIKGLRIVKKSEKAFDYEINFKSPFDKFDKERIKEYIKSVLQTDYRYKCINVSKQTNGRILLVGNRNKLINEMYMSEIRTLF